MITTYTIDKIREIARIEEVLDDFVTMKKRGANLLALCPFHNEKTPSFTISPSKQIYKCFGCGASGNSIRFLMEHESLTFVEALKYLAAKYNIEIEYTDDHQQESQEDKTLKESLQIANSFAQKYFSEYMHGTAAGKQAGLAYLLERGFSEMIIEHFQLGYSPSDGDTFLRHAMAQGFQQDILEQAGLVKTYDSGTRDIFRDRVMFPIHSISGKVLGFGGRILRPNKKAPKYLNTSDTEIYDKSANLYGIFQAKSAIRKADEAILVEGYTDVISLAQAGIENAVASSGTSLTEGQVRLIKRFTENILILYDGDSAGIKAAQRGIDIILEAGLNVRILLLPEGHDPDSFVRDQGENGFNEFVKANRQDFIVFKTKIQMKGVDNDPVKKAEVIKSIVESIALIPEVLKRSTYSAECSNLLGIDESILIAEVNKVRQKKKQRDLKRAEYLQQHSNSISEQLPQIIAPPKQDQQQYDTEKYELFLESEILRILLEFGDQIMDDERQVWQMIYDELGDTEFSSTAFQKLLIAVKTKVTEDGEVQFQHFLQHEDETISKVAIDIVSFPYELSSHWTSRFGILLPEKVDVFERDVYAVLSSYRLLIVNKMIKENEGQRAACKTVEEQMENLRILQKLKAMQTELCKVAGTVIMH